EASPARGPRRKGTPGGPAGQTIWTLKGRTGRFSRAGASPVKRIRLARTPRGDDLVALLLEHADPLGDGDVALGVLVEAVDARRGEHVRDLLVGELDEQVGQELAARLADGRVAQRALKRLPQVPDAAGGVLPDGLPFPRRKVDLVVVE